MAKRISSLQHGDRINLKFHGSKQFGNEPYTLPAEFLGYTGTDDDIHASFALNGSTNDVFEAYRMGNRWVYGASAERLSIVL